jgi:transposase
MSKSPTFTAEQYAAILASRDALAVERCAWLEERAGLRSELRVVTTERDLYHERLKLFQRRLFAAKSEMRDARQQDLFFNEAEALAPGADPAQESEPDRTVDVPAHKRTRRGRKPLDPALPRVTVRHEYPVYACPTCDQSIKVAPAPLRIIPKGLFTETALAWLVVSKFADGLPLYRLAVILRRIGGDISRGTLAASMIRLGQAVQPLINLIRDVLLESDILYGDETTVQVLKEPGRPAQTKSFVWAQMNGTGPPVRLFSYSPTRSTAQAADLYAGVRKGTALMTDGYAPYDEVARVNGLVHLACWVHARRYFVEAEAMLPKDKRHASHLSTRFIALIGELFAVEARAKDMTDTERHSLRQQQSQQVLARIETLLIENLHAVLPQGKLGQALHYLQTVAQADPVRGERRVADLEQRLRELHPTICRRPQGVAIR